MDREQRQRAACAYRRSGMTWREISARVGGNKDVLRRDLTAQGLADGWGDSAIIGGEDDNCGPHIYGIRGKTST